MSWIVRRSNKYNIVSPNETIKPKSEEKLTPRLRKELLSVMLRHEMDQEQARLLSWCEGDGFSVPNSNGNLLAPGEDAALLICSSRDAARAMFPASSGLLLNILFSFPYDCACFVFDVMMVGKGCFNRRWYRPALYRNDLPTPVKHCFLHRR
jgi:hypothetical protein